MPIVSNEITRTCVHCEQVARTESERADMRVVNGDEVCDSCHDELYTRCYACEDSMLTSNGNSTYDQELICNTCLNNDFIICPRCDNAVHRDSTHEHNDTSYCPNCIDRVIDEDEGEPSASFRAFNVRTNKFISPVTKDGIMKSPRIFSAEIETFCTSSNSDFRDALKAIPPEVGAGHDGSIDGEGSCVEFQTPRLAGAMGENLIKDICKILKDKSFDVNKSCGLHVHLDAQDFFPLRPQDNIQQLKNLFAFYIVFDDVITSFLPKERRKNNYCKSLRNNYSLADVMRVSTLSDIESMWYKTQNYNDITYAKSEQRHESRYMGVNFHSLIHSKHLEIRYHSGTINPKKILEWASLHARIMDVCRGGGAYTTSFCFDISTEDDMEAKTKAMFNVLNLPEPAQKYFLARQTKFRVKGQEEEDLTASL